MRRSLMMVAVVASFATRFAWALDPQPPHGTGPLPDLSKNGVSGVVVAADNVSQYRSVLPPEVKDLVSKGELSFEAGTNPREPRRFSAPGRATTSELQLTGTGEIKVVPARGLEAQAFQVPSSVEGDRKQLAYMVMWNAVAATWRHRSLAMELSAYLFDKPAASPHRLGFAVERIYPLSLGESPGTLKPVFREKIAAKKPDAIRELAWLTLRFFGSTDDYVWAASPVVRKIRQLTGSNRADRIFSRAFAPDDLFVWSGKVEAVEPSAIALVPMLVALYVGADPVAAPRGECRVASFADAARIALNAESRRFPQAGGWVPSGVVMVLRNVWRIDLATRDPYSLDARQTLYIDAASGLPVYRVVWDPAGRLRTVVGGALRALVDSEKNTTPFVAGQWIAHLDDNSRVALVVDSMEWCGGVAPGRSLADFDPTSFVKFEAPVAPQKKLEQKAKSDDISD